MRRRRDDVLRGSWRGLDGGDARDGLVGVARRGGVADDDLRGARGVGDGGAAADVDGARGRRVVVVVFGD